MESKDKFKQNTQKDRDKQAVFLCRGCVCLSLYCAINVATINY